MMFEANDDMPRGMDNIYNWVNQFSFSRPMKSTARDFSDAVLMAEILAQLVPAWVQLHNYLSADRIQQKLSNWETLNRKVLTRLKCGVSHQLQHDLANAVPGAIELLFSQVKRATTTSPFLQAKHRASSQYATFSTSPCSRSSSATCSPPLTPSPGNQKKLPPSSQKKSSTSYILHAGGHSRENDPVATSFSKLLQTMSDTSENLEDIIKPINPRARSRANTVPTIQQIREVLKRPLTPNHAKPTLSTMAMVRPASVDVKSRLPQVSPFVFPPKNDHGNVPKKPKMPVDADKKHLPSDMNEFQEGSFVYFLSSETHPVAFSFDDTEDHAQVARVMNTLPSGECTLQLYRRDPSHDSPQNSPTNKTRCYLATPHFIDCCSTLLRTLPNTVCDPQTNTCEWHIRTKKQNSGNTKETRSMPTHNNLKRHFYTEVLTRVMFSSANLAKPISQITESMSPGLCVPCPRFGESFRVPVEPTVFPKIYISLIFELPERFPSRTARKM